MPSSTDDFTREALALETGYSAAGRHVVEVLDRLVRARKAPASIVMDNGPELDSLLWWRRENIQFPRWVIIGFPLTVLDNLKSGVIHPDIYEP